MPHLDAEFGPLAVREVDNLFQRANLAVLLQCGLGLVNLYRARKRIRGQ